MEIRISDSFKTTSLFSFYPKITKLMAGVPINGKLAGLEIEIVYNIIVYS